MCKSLHSISKYSTSLAEPKLMYKNLEYSGFVFFTHPSESRVSSRFFRSEENGAIGAILAQFKAHN